MKIGIVNYFECPACRGTLLFSAHKKAKERVLEGELKCEKCDRKFYIKNGIACFTSCCVKRQTAKDRQKTRKITIEQEIPKTWTRLYSEQEITALKREWNWMLSIIKKEKGAVHLDFATGTGRFLRNVIPKTRGEVIALERDYFTCIELQYFFKKIKNYNRLSVVCADARKMPFRSGALDSVTSWHGLDEPKMEESIKESKRVLKDGTCLAASGIHYQRKSKSFLIAKKEHIRFITKGTIIETLRKANFQRVEYKTFFHGKWNEEGSYLPVFGDSYSIYAIKAEK